MWFSIIGFAIMFVTALVNRKNKDTIKQSMLLKRLVILGILGGMSIGIGGFVSMLMTL